MRLEAPVHQISLTLLKPMLTRLSRRALPQTEGQIYASGLRQPVEIRRDGWGIPHVRAANRHDLFFAQGFVHAQDRLWQLDLNRRAAKGELAVILGKQALATDRLTRTLGFARAAGESWQHADDKVKQDVLSYTDGINAFLANRPALPIEFTMLRYRPGEWTPVDSAAIGHMMAWTLSHGFAGKLARAQLLTIAGREIADALEPLFPRDNPITLPKGIEFNLLGSDGMLQAAKGPYLNRTMDSGGRGSNGWVISGQRSATGHPILCNDMHLPISTPSIWYYVHLAATSDDKDDKGLQVAGVSLPGVPYVLVGHNRHIAWGATVSFVDTEDIFIEQFDPDDPARYRFRDEWQPAQVLEERISVKGQDDHLEKVIVTHHGSTLNQVLQSDSQTLALQSTALQPFHSFSGFGLLNEARGWDDFVKAVNRIEAPTLNLLYADTSGNIGYYVTGKVPIRARGEGSVPVPGWTGEYEWVDWVPFEAMPHALNPEQGFIISANHRIVDDDYPYYLGSSWRNGYRARRIEQLIVGQERVSTGDCRRFHTDMASEPGRQIVGKLEGLSSDDPDASKCLDLLRQWDFQLTAGSVGGAVYQIFLDQIARELLGSRLGQDLTNQVLGKGLHPNIYPINELHGQWPTTLLRHIDNTKSPLLPAGQTWPAILERCLSSTTARLRTQLGDDQDRWTWGRLHSFRMDHTLSVQPPFDRIFGHGPFPAGGDADTVCQISTAAGDSNEHVAPSYRQIVDLGSLADSMAMIVPGQSGHLASPHYANFIKPWFDGDCFPMSWDEDQVSKVTRHRLALVPTLP